MRLLVGAAAALQTACAADKPPGPPTNGADGSSAGDDGSTTDGSSTSQYNASSGYLVVDMLPTPSRCAIDVSPRVTATAVLKPSQKGNDVVITLRSKNRGKLPFLFSVMPPPLPQNVQIISGGTGAEPARVKEVANDLEVTFLYDGTSRQAAVRMMVMCESDGGWVTVTADVDPDRQIPGVPLTTSVEPSG